MKQKGVLVRWLVMKNNNPKTLLRQEISLDQLHFLIISMIIFLISGCQHTAIQYESLVIPIPTINIEDR